MMDDADILIDEMADLLAEENRLIRAADFAALARIAGLKAGLVARLEAAERPAAAGALARIGTAARDNMRLLDAARQGLRAAQLRIAAIRGAAGRLSLYDDRGRAVSIATAAAGFERRA
jgi:hypothetical protein